MHFRCVFGKCAFAKFSQTTETQCASEPSPAFDAVVGCEEESALVTSAKCWHECLTMKMTAIGLVIFAYVTDVVDDEHLLMVCCHMGTRTCPASYMMLLCFGLLVGTVN